MDRKKMSPAQKKWDNRKRTVKRRYSKLSPEKRLKVNARVYTRKMIKKMALIPEDCEGCGKPYEEAHHDDHRYPFEIRWFCKPCHREWHNAVNITGEAMCKDCGRISARLMMLDGKCRVCTEVDKGLSH